MCCVLLQRFLFLRLKVSRLDNIFLTRMHWSNVGGLCGESVLVQVRLEGGLWDFNLPPAPTLYFFCPSPEVQGSWNSFYPFPFSYSRKHPQVWLRRVGVNVEAAFRC